MGLIGCSATSEPSELTPEVVVASDEGGPTPAADVAEPEDVPHVVLPDTQTRDEDAGIAEVVVDVSVPIDEGPDVMVTVDVLEPVDLPTAEDIVDVQDPGEPMDSAVSEDLSLPDGPDSGTPDADGEPPDCSGEAQLALYKKRIEPLVNGTKPSSCNQCHLSGVDLSMYVKGTPCKTMGCLQSGGMVDLSVPEDSEILKQIKMADPASPLITQDVIDQEHDGFLEWIQFASECFATVCGAQESPCSGSVVVDTPPDVLTPLGGCEEPELLESFDQLVFEWRDRCHGCHSNCKPEYAPCWYQEDFDKNDPLALKEAAMQTMYNLIGIGAVNVDAPSESLMILKPLKESLGGVKHGGGEKFFDESDDAWQDFELWTGHYSACFNGTEQQNPRVKVVLPPNKKKFYEGTVITWKAEVTDLQDGLIVEPASITWTSNLLVEPFGNGPGPFKASLSLGKHMVTVTGVDADGNIGQRVIKVWIKTLPPPPE